MTAESSKRAIRWRERLHDVEGYMQSHQGQEPTNGCKRNDLCKWVRSQRFICKRGKLAKWKIEKLNLLGIDATTEKPYLCRILTYFGCFGGEIQPHQDNAPSSATPYFHNSQIVGSTVMCLSLFDSMDYDIVTLEPRTSGCKDYIVEKTFKTSNGTLYLMSAFCDFNHKHRAKFPSRVKGKKKRGLIRTAIIWRWLGRRTFGFDTDYQGERKRCEVWDDCKKLAKRKWPHCTKSRENFDVRVGKRYRSI